MKTDARAEKLCPRIFLIFPLTGLTIIRLAASFEKNKVVSNILTSKIYRLLISILNANIYLRQQKA